MARKSPSAADLEARMQEMRAKLHQLKQKEAKQAAAAAAKATQALGAIVLELHPEITSEKLREMLAPKAAQVPQPAYGSQ